MSTQNLRARASALLSDIDGYLVAPPKRGGGDAISRTSDPRRLPTSETLLQIAVDLNHVADTLASGAGAELMTARHFDRLQAGTIVDCVKALRARALVVTAAPGVRRSTLVRAVRLAAIENRDDASDAFVSMLLSDLELRLSDWVSGAEPDDDVPTEDLVAAFARKGHVIDEQFVNDVLRRPAKEA